MVLRRCCPGLWIGDETATAVGNGMRIWEPGHGRFAVDVANETGTWIWILMLTWTWTVAIRILHFLSLVRGPSLCPCLCLFLFPDPGPGGPCTCHLSLGVCPCSCPDLALCTCRDSYPCPCLSVSKNRTSPLPSQAILTLTANATVTEIVSSSDPHGSGNTGTRCSCGRCCLHRRRIDAHARARCEDAENAATRCYSPDLGGRGRACRDVVFWQVVRPWGIDVHGMWCDQRTTPSEICSTTKIRVQRGVDEFGLMGLMISSQGGDSAALDGAKAILDKAAAEFGGKKNLDDDGHWR